MPPSLCQANQFPVACIHNFPRRQTAKTGPAHGSNINHGIGSGQGLCWQRICRHTKFRERGGMQLPQPTIAGDQAVAQQRMPIGQNDRGTDHPRSCQHDPATGLSLKQLYPAIGALFDAVAQRSLRIAKHDCRRSVGPDTKTRHSVGRRELCGIPGLFFGCRVYADSFSKAIGLPWAKVSSLLTNIFSMRPSTGATIS